MYSNKSMGMENKGREEMSEITDREKFEEWCGDTSWTPYQKSIMFLAWQEQQKKIDELEQQWISVNDKLPKKSAIDKPVKVWITYCGYMSEAYFSDEGEFCKEWDGKRYYSKITGVTHWMSLPDPPQEDEG